MRSLIEMPADKYHDDPCEHPSLSSSIAKILIMQSPLHAWHSHPRFNLNARQENKEAFDIGTAAHALLLEGEDCMAVIDADDWRTKAAKAAREEAREAGKIPVLPHQKNAILKMVNAAHGAIAQCSDLSGIKLSDGLAERVILWQDDNIYLRARLDWVSNDRKLILDLKTTDTNASPETFSNQIARMNYDLQAAHYLEANDVEGAKFVFMVQEVTAPHAVSFVGVSPSMLELGQMKLWKAKEIWRECITKKEWPGYSKRIAWAEAPTWATQQWQLRGLE